MYSRRRFLTGGRELPQSGGGAGARKARVEPGCLAAQGTVCRTCGEHCEPGAIRFRLLPAGKSLPLIDDALCNACGDCVRVCPVQAMALRAIAEAAA